MVFCSKAHDISWNFHRIPHLDHIGLIVEYESRIWLYELGLVPGVPSDYARNLETRDRQLKIQSAFILVLEKGIELYC